MYRIIWQLLFLCITVVVIGICGFMLASDIGFAYKYGDTSHEFVYEAVAGMILSVSVLIGAVSVYIKLHRSKLSSTSLIYHSAISIFLSLVICCLVRFAFDLLFVPFPTPGTDSSMGMDMGIGQFIAMDIIFAVTGAYLVPLLVLHQYKKR